MRVIHLDTLEALPIYSTVGLSHWIIVNSSENPRPQPPPKRLERTRIQTLRPRTDGGLVHSVYIEVAYARSKDIYDSEVWRIHRSNLIYHHKESDHDPRSRLASAVLARRNAKNHCLLLGVRCVFYGVVTKVQERKRKVQQHTGSSSCEWRYTESALGLNTMLP